MKLYWCVGLAMTTSGFLLSASLAAEAMTSQPPAPATALPAAAVSPTTVDSYPSRTIRTNSFFPKLFLSQQ